MVSIESASEVVFRPLEYRRYKLVGELGGMMLWMLWMLWVEGGERGI